VSEAQLLATNIGNGVTRLQAEGNQPREIMRAALDLGLCKPSRAMKTASSNDGRRQQVQAGGRQVRTGGRQAAGPGTQARERNMRRLPGRPGPALPLR
jgi:putative hemin transport protein